MSRTNAPSKHQSREGKAAKHNADIARFKQLAKNCGFHAAALYLKNRGYNFEQAHTLIFGTSPAERQEQIRINQATGWTNI